MSSSMDIHFPSMVLPDYGVDKYDIGTAFAHFGIAVEDVSLNFGCQNYITFFPFLSR